jgi:hypothetical protein
MDEQNQSGQWAILELMGRKVVAGYLTKDDWQGHAMLRIDVPATPDFPAFTQVYGPQSVYCITYVSQEVARMAANANQVNPVSVYVPDLAAMQTAQRKADQLREKLGEMRELLKSKRLPAPATDPYGGDDVDDDNDEGDGEQYPEISL